MKKIKNEIGNDVFIFAETFEYEAYNQIKRLANYEPYQHEIIRVMPDAHAGKGCVVGTTMTISDKITPNLVGVDIGCGMLSVSIEDSVIDLDKIDAVIDKHIPPGFNTNTETKRKFDFERLRCFKHVDAKRASLSIGTLGGGNHFIELAKGSQSGKYYLIIHSGSRKLGSDICKYYQDKAFKSLNDMSQIRRDLIDKLKDEGREKDIAREIKKIKKPSANKELAHLTGKDFDDYMNDMKVAQEYAVLNRATMADIIIKEMKFRELSRLETIHNYIDFKRMILRKGAVSAEYNETLLIPINMRDGSLLCTGKGNPNWNFSAPHGAGRLMSRSKAKEEIDLDGFIESMKGIKSSSIGASTLDEAPDAYKSIDEITRAIKDTVDIVAVLKPVYNFKAH